MAAKRRMRAVVSVANDPEVCRAYRGLAEARAGFFSKKAIEHRHLALSRAIAKARGVETGKNGSDYVRAVFDYLESTLADPEPKILTAEFKDYRLYKIPEKQRGYQRKGTRLVDFAPDLRLVECRIEYFLDLVSNRAQIGMAVAIVLGDCDFRKRGRSREPYARFGVFVGRNDDGCEFVECNGPAQALALADYYKRNGMPNPIRRKRLRQRIKKMTAKVRSEERELKEMKTELRRLG